MKQKIQTAQIPNGKCDFSVSKIDRFLHKIHTYPYIQHKKQNIKDWIQRVTLIFMSTSRSFLLKKRVQTQSHDIIFVEFVFHIFHHERGFSDLCNTIKTTRQRHKHKIKRYTWTSPTMPIYVYIQKKTKKKGK